MPVMANPEAPRSPLADVVSRAVTRRDVLKGAVGIAGLAALPALVVACGPGTAASVSAGTFKLGSNYSDAVPKGVLQGIVDTFTKNSGVTVTINTVDHGTFQDQLNSYLQGTPDDVFTWFSGFRMRFFAAKGLATDISDVWTKIGANYSDAFKVASTGDDSKQYFVPIYNYPWAVFYRKSVFSANSWTPPTTLDEFKALADKMKTANLIPLAFGDKDGWPAMGTFDILNLRKNGYQFHVDLMAGKQKWTDAKVKDVFALWQTLLPYMQDGAAGRTWQDAAQALVQKKAGMYLLGMFVSQQFQATGAADLADLDFFPFPNLGTTFDAEKALDAPIDGFMISSKSPSLTANLAGSKAFVEYIGQPATQVAWVTKDPGNIAAAKNADTGGYTALQKKAAELIGAAQKITQFLDRDTNPNFAGANGMQAFLLDFLKTPSQDLDAMLAKIQKFWDTLPAS
jgi:multiple sugar transport system substrate-binding protein